MNFRLVAALPVAVAAAWFQGAHAQQPAQPVVGWLNPQPLGTSRFLLDGFRAGLREAGFIEGKNVTIALRPGDGQRGRMPALAADLVRHGVAVIMAGSPPAALAAKRATETIPIVFTSGADPIRIGLVSSFNRPGGNATGVHIQFSQVVGKRLTLLHETVPRATRVAVLVNPRNRSDAETTVRKATEAARSLGLEIEIFNTRTANELEEAFQAMADWRANALLVGPDPFLASLRKRVSDLAMRHGLPSSAFGHSWVTAGSLMHYGPDNADNYRMAGVYVGRILKGENPGELPVLQPTKFEMSINLKTARALGIDVPQSILFQANQVVE
jgi:putative ABC transport system substrate-binding protein